MVARTEVPSVLVLEHAYASYVVAASNVRIHILDLLPEDVPRVIRRHTVAPVNNEPANY
jgi:hypothetical protein